ncbi:hypothetical protein M9978_18880 [Sphingomonas sp. MG17]|uniref:Uncharacterized protein n=1 Tax=Sphingomonas tagetis TaxID=2949092 RepID=A0A9X2KN71_9SPHN|nr:hypothetical protein [Sphingomonas tagetis]MCP3732492.1 hypothetical protein [Sphingomonas tagetis]
MDDAAYFRRRAREERERAATCEDNPAALAHLRMADEYERRARHISMQLMSVPSQSEQGR